MRKKILHIPCNTPYVQKLNKENSFEVVNKSNEIYPIDITFQHILAQASNDTFWKDFDICHIHYWFELESFEVFKQAIELIRVKLKPIVYTCHESESVHGIPLERYQQYQNILFKYANQITTLTSTACDKIDSQQEVHVIPHWKVTNHIVTPHQSEKINIMFLGALRDNRDIVSTLINTILWTKELNVEITFLTRAFSQKQLHTIESLDTLIQLMHISSHVNLDLSLPLPDQQFTEKVSKADILVLPYLSAWHSWQLELALDLGILPIITDVGNLKSQIDFWPELYSKFTTQLITNWSDGKKWLYQARILKSIQKSIELLPTFRQQVSSIDITHFRQDEHRLILNKHETVYNNTK